MIILQVSDLHGHRGMIEKISNKTKEIGADLIIFVGDVTNFGTIEEFKSILLDLSRITNRKIYFVPGNCDPREALNAKVSENIVNLHMKIEEDRSLIFGGIGGSNKTPFSTPIELDENEIERILREFSAIDFRRFVLVTHVPPYKTLDKVRFGRHVGSKELREFIETYQPRLILTAHIHESRGIYRLGESLIINAGPAANGYAAVIKIKIEKKDEITVSANLIEL